MQIIEGPTHYTCFLPWRLYNTLFESRESIDDEHRGRLWVKLLNAEKNKNAANEGMYQKLVSMENEQLEHTIDKD